MDFLVTKKANTNLLHVKINKTKRRSGELISIYCFYFPYKSKEICILKKKTNGEACYTIKDDKLNQKILKLLLDQKLNYQEWRSLSCYSTNYKELAQDLKARIKIKRLLKLKF